MTDESTSPLPWPAVLVRQAQRGDRAAFDRVAGHYRPLVQALAFVRTGDLAEAEDLAQDVLLRAWRKLPSLHDPGRFLPWLRAITANACHTWFRQARSASLSDPAGERLWAPGPLPLEALLTRERQRELHRALVVLPDANRTALLMHVWGGYSYREIADATGVRVTTVEGRIYRAKDHLRRLLRDDGADFLGAPDKQKSRRRLMTEETTSRDAFAPTQPLALVLFTHQFATLIEAGVSLVRTFHILQSAPAPYGSAARALQERVEQGNTVSQVMADFPALFPKFYVAFIRAGEVGGVLDETLRRAADLLTHEWKLATRHSVNRAEGLFLVLPPSAQLPNDWDGLTDAQQLMTRLLFCETFGLLVRSGAPILQTMQVVADLLPGTSKQKMLEAREAVKRGERWALDCPGMLPRFALELIAVGEEHGTLDLTLEQAASIFEHELECRATA